MFYSLCQFLIVHIIRICLVKIVHKLTDFVITFIVSIYIYNMRTILKYFTCLSYISVNMVYR